MHNAKQSIFFENQISKNKVRAFEGWANQMLGKKTVPYPMPPKQSLSYFPKNQTGGGGGFLSSQRVFINNFSLAYLGEMAQVV
jgi:hypothetical protein